MTAHEARAKSLKVYGEIEAKARACLIQSLGDARDRAIRRGALTCTITLTHDHVPNLLRSSAVAWVMALVVDNFDGYRIEVANAGHTVTLDWSDPK